MKTFVIGDIHGCYDELLQLLEEINPDWKSDKVIMLGDYIDRGEKSYETVRFVQDLRGRHGRNRVILLLGNHEQMAIDYYENGNERWFRNGAEATLESFEKNRESIEDYLGFFRTLDNYHEDEHYIYVHAGIKPGISLGEQSTRDLTWIREEFYLHPHASGKSVVFGHTPTRHIDGGDYPAMLNGNIGLDTACVYGGALSAIIFDNDRIERIHQVKCRKESYTQEQA